MCFSGKGITKTPTEKVFLHVKLPETPSMYVFQERSNKLLIRGYLKNLVKTLDELCRTRRAGHRVEKFLLTICIILVIVVKIKGNKL